MLDVLLRHRPAGLAFPIGVASDFSYCLCREHIVEIKQQQEAWKLLICLKE